MFYVMKDEPAHAAGARKIATSFSREGADRLARRMDTKLNGRSMGKTFVLDQAEYDEWHVNNVMPLYYR